jgi:hypothetical protein
MATLDRIPVVWSGLTALPGVSIFYASAGAANPVGDLNTFFTALVGKFPNGLQWSLPGAGDTIDDTTGHINGVWASTGSGTLSAVGGATAYAAGTGSKVVWLTNGLTAKFRRVKGHTVMAPLIATQFDTNGTLLAAYVTALQNAANTLVAAAKFNVWHRPTPGSNNGFSSLWTGANVPDQVISLRSRRY